MKDGKSVQDHLKAMTELFNKLAAVGDVISEHDCVAYLLASLPDSFGVLLRSYFLEANKKVPKMEIVTEFTDWKKQNEKTGAD